MTAVIYEMCIRDSVLFAFALSAGHREVDRVVSIDLKKITIGQRKGKQDVLFRKCRRQCFCQMCIRDRAIFAAMVLACTLSCTR